MPYSILAKINKQQNCRATLEVVLFLMRLDITQYFTGDFESDLT